VLGYLLPHDKRRGDMHRRRGSGCGFHDADSLIDTLA